MAVNLPSLHLEEYRGKGPPWFPRSFSRNEKTEPPPQVLCLYFSDDWAWEKAEKCTVTASSGTNKKVWEGQRKSLHHLPAFPDDEITRAYNNASIFFFLLRIPKAIKFKSATNGLPVSCFIFVTDFKNYFLQDQSLSHILLSFQFFASFCLLQSFAFCNPYYSG